ncbi:MAG: MarC family transcriptional regulator [Oceanospirillaceae bacterium]|nr:MarC family transcriptional regulator [Oceanospirillaceae bacterium]
MDFVGLLNEFVLLWAVVDPIGTVPVFLAVAAGLSLKEQRRLALKAVLVASGVLLFFAIAGEALLQAMDLPLASFQVAGGLILFIFALTMIFGPGKPDDEIDQIGKNEDLAVYPLAIPSIASPGAILATILMTDSHRHSLEEQVVSILLLVTVLLCTLLLLLLAPVIQRVIGRAGASIASRTMGFLIAAVAADHVIEGVSIYVRAWG